MLTQVQRLYFGLHFRELELTTAVAVIASTSTIVVQLAAVHGVVAAFVELGKRGNDWVGEHEGEEGGDGDDEGHSWTRGL